MRRKRKPALIATTRLQAYPCPGCGKHLEAVTGASVSLDGSFPDRPTPGPGSYTICGYCAKLLKFNRQMRPIGVSPQEQNRAIEQNPLEHSTDAPTFRNMALAIFHQVPHVSRVALFHSSASLFFLYEAAHLWFDVKGSRVQIKRISA